MRKIELLKAGKSGLEGRLLKANTFQHHTGYQINIFPFKTQPGGHVFKNDFLSFQGILGEVIRLSNNTELYKFKDTANYKTELKQTILKNVLEKVETSEKKQLEDIINKMYFEPDNSLFKYDFHVISYKNFINNNNAIKDVPVFISDVFIQYNERFKALFSENESKNILNQLISECLPNHIDKKDGKRDKQVFRNMIPSVTEIFQKDFDFLMSSRDYFLENFELFFKYYYFFYFTQLTFKLDNFGQQDYNIKPIYFSMDWENLSESRLQLHKTGWKEVSKHYERVFAHANALELINYIQVDNNLIGDYGEITNLFNSFEESEKEEFKTCLEELLEFYKNEVKTLNPSASWEQCQSNLNLKSFDQEITTLIYSLWYTIRYQFENGKRNKPYKDYALWLSSFSKENFTKSGGRLGSKLVFSQEILLFLTKLCVGNREKIRLKLFWEKLQERGITFDETSKLEVIKLFERINLIEKKATAVMHNTLNPLYKYISELIVEFFINQQIRPGDRYNLYLEEKSYVKQLFDALRSTNALNIELFSYQHPSGNVPFESFTIEINDTKVLVVSSENATEDYFTMLRNNVSQQALGFENTAMLIIYSQKLESISGGSENLEKDGMPLHYLSFRKRVEKDINENKTLKYHEKEILKAVLNYKTKNILEDNNSVFDYEFVIKVLEKGTIDTVDFQTLGLFPHKELATKGTKVDVDIQENYKLFGRIEAIFQDDEPETELKEILPETAYTKFIKEDWKTTDFGDLFKWLETEKNKSIPEITSISCDSKDITLWKRTDGLTVSKKRNYNLLVFNQNLLEDIVVEIKFDQRTKKEGINYKGRDLTVQSSGYNLLVTLPKCENTSNFHLIEYRDHDSGKKFLFKLLHVPFESNYLSQFESNFLIRAGSLGNYLSVKDDNIIIFNEGEQQVIEELEYSKNYVVPESSSLKLNCDYANIDAEEVYFQITIKETLISIHIKPDFDPPRFINGLEVWKAKRINKSDFRYKQENEIIKIQLKTEQQERTVSGEFRKNLILEQKLTNSDGYSWEENVNEEISEISLDLDQSVKDAFDQFRAVFRTKKVQPSLAYLEDSQKEIASKYVKGILNYITAFAENQILTSKQKNVFLLGVVKENSGAKKIKLSPYHPLNVAYQLQINRTLEDDTQSYNAILKRLNPNNLLAYIEGKSREIYVPTESVHSPEWMYYSMYSDTKQGISKSYVSNLISSKIKDFKSNYSILFDQSKQAPIRINVINQGDCKEV